MRCKMPKGSITERDLLEFWLSDHLISYQWWKSNILTVKKVEFDIFGSSSCFYLVDFPSSTNVTQLISSFTLPDTI